jgi:uncharacterized protein (TIGR03437 family)
MKRRNLACANLVVLLSPMSGRAASTITLSGTLAAGSVSFAGAARVLPPPSGTLTFSGTVTVDANGNLTGWDIAMPAVLGLRAFEFTPATSIPLALKLSTVTDALYSCPSAHPTHLLELSSMDGLSQLFLYYTPAANGAFANPLLTPLVCNFNGADTHFVYDSVYGSYVSDIGVPITGGTSTGQPPTISPGGVTPIGSGVSVVQPGSWVSIYGANLASGTAIWNGDFQATLLGTSVTINNKAAFMYFVSPGQINVQAPDDSATGAVSVIVTTAAGSAASTVTLAAFGPSLSLLDGKHVAAIIPRSDGSGAYGGGTYDIAGPTGTSLGYKTVAAKSGDSVVFFGIGFGPTNPPVPAGKPFTGAAPTTNPVQLLINNVPVTPVFSGMTSAGLYQFNVTIPAGLGTGDVPVHATVAGISSPSGAVLSVQ